MAWQQTTNRSSTELIEQIWLGGMQWKDYHGNPVNRANQGSDNRDKQQLKTDLYA